MSYGQFKTKGTYVNAENRDKQTMDKNSALGLKMTRKPKQNSACEKRSPKLKKKLKLKANNMVTK